MFRRLLRAILKRLDTWLDRTTPLGPAPVILPFQQPAPAGATKPEGQTMKTVVEEYMASPEHMRLFQQERAIYEVTELLEALLKESGISRAEFAKRLGKTKEWVAQLLDGDSNKTIRTVADACAVLGYEFCVSSRPIQISNATATAPVFDPLADDEPPATLPLTRLYSNGRAVLAVRLMLAREEGEQGE